LPVTKTPVVVNAVARQDPCTKNNYASRKQRWIQWL